MSVRQIVKSLEILCIVPDERKAQAVKASVEGDVLPMTPASILQTHPNATLYLDRDSAALLAPSVRGEILQSADRMKLEFPGLFDLQVNGFAGIDFNAPGLTREGLAEALERQRATGVTRCLPTLITSSFDRFARNARVIARSPDPAVAGIHMEGPVPVARGRAEGRASARARDERHHRRLRPASGGR